MEGVKNMTNKIQNYLTLSVFAILLLLTLPGYYLIVEEHSDNTLSVVVLIFSQLFILLSISIAIKNIIISIIIKSFSNEFNSIQYEIIDRKNFSIKTFQAISNVMVILIIMSGYCLVYLFMPLQYMVIYSSMFIAVYNLSINIVPNRIVFINNDCIIHNKINNIFYSVKSYSIKGSQCTLNLYPNSNYDLIIDKDEIENLIKKFESANITRIV